MQVGILYSALAFLVPIRQAKRLNILFLNNTTFLALYILHNKNEHFCLILESRLTLILLSLPYRFGVPEGDALAGI